MTLTDDSAIAGEVHEQRARVALSLQGSAFLRLEQGGHLSTPAIGSGRVCDRITRVSMERGNSA